jgi:hypothetical protein
VRFQKVLLLALVVALAVAAFAVVGCGDSSDEAAKATMLAALTKVETTVADLTQKGASLTVADVKATRDAMKSQWQIVIDSAKKVKGADAAKAEKAWTDLDTAVNSIPDNATIVEAGQIIMVQLPSFMAVESELKKLAEPSK